jgi:hypothetical protein
MSKLLNRREHNGEQKVALSFVLSALSSVSYFLIQLTAHFSYHLGQINYHRRLLQ